MKSLLTTAAVLALAAAPALAQTSTTPQSVPPSTSAPSTTAPGHQVSQQDQHFFQEAATGGKAEVDAGRYVQEHGDNPAVREFGRWMVTDHTMANDMLQRVAQANGMQVPTALDHEQQEMMSKLQKQKGAELDRTYIHGMVQDHEKDVQLFQQEGQSGQDPQLKTFAQRVLPALQQHLAEAQELQRTVVAGETGHRR